MIPIRNGSVLSFVGLALAVCLGCSGGAPSTTTDAEPPDATPLDANARDAGTTADAVAPDANVAAPDGSGPSLASLSDTFEGTTLSAAWSVFNASAVTVSVHDGALYLEPNKAVLWYAASQGILVYKLVTGSFKATTTVHARRSSDPTAPPNQNIHLGGIMARSPSSSGEDYFFGVVGQAEMGRLAIEHKSTRSSVSDFGEEPWPSADADLRLCRVGSAFQILTRPVGTTAWSVYNSVDRPDLPAQLQVGPNCYANSTPPDLLVSFDEVLFADVSDLAGCAAD